MQDKLGPEGVTLVTDPFNKELGLKVPNFEAGHCDGQPPASGSQ